MPCRLCLVEDQILIPIYDEYGVDRRGIASTITKFLGLQLLAHESPPTQICISCWANLDNFQKFCRLIEEKQQSLHVAAAELEHDVPTPAKRAKHEETKKSSSVDHTVAVKLECVPDGDTALLPCCDYNVSEGDAVENKEISTNNAAKKVECAHIQQSLVEQHSSQSGYTGEIDDAVSWKLLNCASPTCSPVHVFWKIPRRSDGRVVRKRCSLCYKNLKAETGSTYIATRRAKQVDTECSSCKKTFCLKCFNKYHKKE